VTKSEAARQLAIIVAEMRLALDADDPDCPAWPDQLLAIADSLDPSGFVDESVSRIDTRYQAPPAGLPSLPWTWTGGYPQRITGPDATLIAEVWESPDAAAVIAPTICDSVNSRFGWDGSKTYDETIS
jgi:hypothetical protein